jgi:para-aminobenzoate synthetase component 1
LPYDVLVWQDHVYPPARITGSPAEVLRCWPSHRPVVLLHSGRLHEQWSRWSILAEPAGAWIGQEQRSRCLGDVGSLQPTADIWQSFDALAGDQALWVGYVGYDIVRQIEQLPSVAQDDRRWPTWVLQRCPGWWLHDALYDRWWVGGTWIRAGGPAWWDRESSATARELSFEAGPASPLRSRQRHEQAVERVLEYIASGDVFQVNLAQRFSADFRGDPRGLYAALHAASPAWYAAYLEMIEGVMPSDASAAQHHRAAIVSTSPELFLQVDATGDVITRPIKGTRPVGVAPQELRDSAKDAAELAMIVDLLRNDLGRVCRFGSIAVTEPRAIETHPTVHHAVATVRGSLRSGVSLGGLLRAVMPGGSITGAPKVRAMQIIEELEPVRRGPYCGAIGCVLPGGCGRFSASFNIAIRTMLLDAGRVDFYVGGGIVADSQPSAEYDETLTKAAAMLTALHAGQTLRPTSTVQTAHAIPHNSA